MPEDNTNQLKKGESMDVKEMESSAIDKTRYRNMCGLDGS